MNKELISVLTDFSLALHELEEAYPEEDLPMQIEDIWTKVTLFLLEYQR